MRGTSHGVADAARIYNLDAWGRGYFTAEPGGRVAVHGPQGPVALPDIVARAREQGLNTPLLLRFPHILRDRAQQLSNAFDAAIAEAGYGGCYTPIYPIKVNQQGSVVRELLAHPTLGLEAGSKPELLAVLGLLPPGRPIVCNGYKDAAYIRMALAGERLGHPTTIVIEKMSEIALIAQLARQTGVRPRLGVRVRLASVSKGHWQNTGGEKSKFGLTAPQVSQALAALREAGLLDCLRLVHFHLGSQVANLRDIRAGLREAARYYVELARAGAPLAVVDVGGGLGVDYDGTASRASCSMNYTLADYAAAVVEALHRASAEAGSPQPDILSESGRALTAHHAVLVTNISDCERAQRPTLAALPENAPGLLAELAALRDIPMRPLECLEEGRVLIDQCQAAFARGDFGLAERAQAEELWLQVQYAVRDALDGASNANRSQREALDDLRERLADKLFANFSVFQSLPDIWAIDQVFPIMPLQRLGERPTRHGLIRDLTCDSDGRIDHYVDRDGLESTLAVHDIAEGEDYLLGFFLVGAYQEILGDMHNLFGDTDTANVALGEKGDFHLVEVEHGDRGEELLEYVHVPVAELKARYREKAAAAALGEAAAEELLGLLERGLGATTYLS